MKPWTTTLIALIALIVLMGCTAVRDDQPKAVLEDYKVGETVYVCGCPMMCCNSIAKQPGGRCMCGHRLRRGIVSRIRDGKVYVQVSDREKSFFITSR
jgi:hypothetical protein